MRKMILSLLTVFCLITSAFVVNATEDVTENTQPPEIQAEPTVILYDFDTLDGKHIAGTENISLYEIPEGDRSAFYDDFSTLQRTGSGESYIEFSIPAECEFSVVTYHWQQEVEDFKFFTFSEDEWSEVTPVKETEALEGKWTTIEYGLEIAEATILRVYWPENETWWTPVMSKAELVYQAVATSLETDYPENIEIPIYDCNTYNLSAKVIDQLLMDMDCKAVITIDDIEGVTFKDNILIINENVPDGTALSIKAEYTDGDIIVSDTKTYVLTKALIGDTNADGVIDREDLNVVLGAFEKTSDDEKWLDIRLCDVDKNGMIDVLDIAYIAKNILEEE